MYIANKMGVKGFTILEILLVVVVASIITTMSIVVFTRYSSHHRLAGIAQTINQDIKWARQLAREKGTNQVIHFRCDKKEYRIYSEGDSLHPYEIRKLPAGVRYGLAQAIPEPEPGVGKPTDGVQLTNNRATFTPYGIVNTGVVYLTNDREYYAIVIYEIGTTRVWRWNGSNWE